MALVVENADLDRRVLLLAPTVKDGEISRSLLTRAELSCLVCKNLLHLSQEIKIGGGAVLLTEEAIASANIDELLKAIDEQPSWSDLPLVILMRGGSESPVASGILKSLRNVTLLERPAPMRSVLSAVQAAVRGRVRQYQIRDQIETIRFAEQAERAARADAERASRMKDEFLATLSHELRTPLNAIFGWTQLLKTAGADQETIEQAIDVIDRNVRLQSQLIADLLDVSRIISGKVRLDVQPVDLTEVITSALEGVKPAAQAKEITIQKVLDPRAGAVSGDPARLQQVFWNLLTNAIKFTPKNGKVHVVAERVNSHVQISVHDNGEGIKPEFLPLLFERFSQADSSTKRKHGGLGLGLSIVKSLVELHGGSIRATSPGEGQGSTFVIKLPLRATTSHDSQSLPSPDSLGPEKVECDPEKLAGVKVLVVDDEPDARELVRRLLADCHAEVVVAGSAKVAAQRVESFKPDVILSDIGMPHQDGYDFIREIRGKGITTPAVALTAFARAEDRIRSIQAGYQSHLPKPVEPSELIAVVASLAGRYGSKK